ncbi:hypothetical protein [Acidisphaera sp. S103]|nr:hypothetical protein [Acidisphaera sp. S103]
MVSDQLAALVERHFALVMTSMAVVSAIAKVRTAMLIVGRWLA